MKAYNVEIQNKQFYREASRAGSIREINESAGIKAIITREIEKAKQALARDLMDSMKIEIKEGAFGYYVQATLPDQRSL